MSYGMPCERKPRALPNANIHVSHHIQETRHNLERKKRTQSSEFIFLFRKVDENAPNVSQIIPFLVSWSVNIAYCRSSFSDAHKLVRDEVFIKSYIPPDTQYSSTQLRRKAIHWRDENPREWCCAPRRAVLRSENSYKWVTPRAGTSKEVRLVEYVEISSVNEVLVWSTSVLPRPCPMTRRSRWASAQRAPLVTPRIF